ncbi:hypothetical protein GmHk_02G005852 [Glycine max]|nr:hypothetical protein GmHk_02G005852 [Glycine max]
MHNSLPTNCFIFDRHITQDASCHLFGVTEETMLHVLHIRNHEGAWLIGFSGSCGTTTNLNAELQAIAKGAVVCESDSKTALMLIDEGVHDTHPYAPIVSYIKSLSNISWDLMFAHSLPEGNSCAD